MRQNIQASSFFFSSLSIAFKLERLKRSLIYFECSFYMSRYVTVLMLQTRTTTTITEKLNSTQNKHTYNQRAKINAKSNKLSPRDWISKHNQKWNLWEEKNALALTEVEAGEFESSIIERHKVTLFTPGIPCFKEAFFFETINRFHKRHNRHKNIKLLHMFLSPLPRQQTWL